MKTNKKSKKKTNKTDNYSSKLFSDNKMFKNKKGALGGIVETISGIMNFLVETIPKPVLFLLFLLILLLFAQLITYVLNVAGVFCTTTDQPVKLEGGNIFTNIGLIGDIPDPNLAGLDAIVTEDLPLTSRTVDSCARQIDQATLTDANGVQTQLNTATWFYDGKFCTSCESVKIQEKDDLNVTLNTYNLCVGDVTRKPTEEKTLRQKAFCDTVEIGCQPPTHYYYDTSTNLYLCSDDTCEGRTIGDAWNDKLEENGAKLIYPEISNGNTKSSYTDFMGVACMDFKPKMTVYGIDVFDYKLWMVILLIIILFWGLAQMKGL